MPAYKTKTSVVKNRVAVMPRISYAIDASGKNLGRVASDAAMALLGKKSAHYEKNAVLNVEVTVSNVSKMVLTEKRLRDKSYLRYSGYPGALYETKLPEMVAKKGKEEVLRRAVMGMIPRNGLRKERMKRLILVD
ncbi:MAG: large subunit ribosomal protein L13 [Parcubacteria bacterium C7867-001]|nr:MAG: large subunit ribosomal protein L13 [Parcubacteria bacterium C7867-001]